MQLPLNLKGESTETSETFTLHSSCAAELSSPKQPKSMYAMEPIYANDECVKPDNPTPSTNYTGKREVIEQGGYNICYYY